ncbi:MAG: metallophosphoesterase [Clostridia bacterium]|nr:metallophosphoesterase [Clostridia bacterium]
MLYVLCFILIAGMGLLLYGWWDTNRFDVRKTEIELERLPAAFDGFTILQVSDLHNRAYGRDGRDLIRAVEGLSFDCIAITGDLLDRHLPKHRENGYRFAMEAAKLGPTYCVEGNHEWNIGWAEVMKDLTKRSVHVLNNEAVSFQRGDAGLELIGSRNRATVQEIRALVSPDVCSVLLAHHPERIEDYACAGVDLVLAGHAHGGQIRLFNRGLFSPDQGVLPRYTSGLYTCGRTKQYVSRGAGNHSFLPPRIFNRPEIDLITLKTPSR